MIKQRSGLQAGMVSPVGADLQKSAASVRGRWLDLGWAVA